MSCMEPPVSVGRASPCICCWTISRRALRSMTSWRDARRSLAGRWSAALNWRRTCLPNAPPLDRRVHQSASCTPPSRGLARLFGRYRQRFGMGRSTGPCARPQIQGRFEVFLTIDKGFEFEHDLKKLSFGIVVLETANNQKLRAELKGVLQRYKDPQDIIAILGIDALSDEDKLTVSRGAQDHPALPLAALQRGRAVHRRAGQVREAGRHDPRLASGRSWMANTTVSPRLYARGAGIPKTNLNYFLYARFIPD